MLGFPTVLLASYIQQPGLIARHSMSAKGKEKAMATVIVLSESEDEAANFFVKKRKRPVARPRELLLATGTRLLLKR